MGLPGFRAGEFFFEHEKDETVSGEEDRTPAGEGRPAAPVLIALRDVSYRYALPGGGERAALDGVSLSLRRGERIVVLGAAGSGKTTLACLLAGLFEPAGGAVERGSLLQDHGGRCLAAGLVTQNPEDTFTSPVVREEMGMVLQNLSWEDGKIDGAVDSMLEETGLGEYADSPPALLSGGQKQLLALASILIADPSLLILDEPLSLLDPRGREEVSSLISGKGHGGERSLIYLSSEVEDALIADRVAVLLRGKMVWEGPGGDLPVDEKSLSAWGLVPPDLSRVFSLLFPGRVSGRGGLWRPRELAEFLCRYD
jgi:energy-coupling factor transport system ATP-binding protein